MAMRGVRLSKRIPGYASAWFIHSSSVVGKTRRPNSTSLATSQHEITLTPSPSLSRFTDRLRVVFGKLRISVHPPNPHVRIENDHPDSSQSPAATGSNGSV